MSRRYQRRAATSGDVNLNSSRKDGNTLTYWYWINMGRASCGRDHWLEFDIRDLAEVSAAVAPALITSDELQQCMDGKADFETLLQRDLQRVADWCASINALSCLAALAPKGAIWHLKATDARMHGVTDDDGNLLLGQRSDGSPIWNDAEDPLPLRRAMHFTEAEARCKAWELAGAGYGPTGISHLYHGGTAGAAAGAEGQQ